MSKKSAINLSCACILLWPLFFGCSAKTRQNTEVLSYEARSNGDTFLAEGKTIAAIQEYQKACHFQPSSWQSHYKLATAYEKLGKLDAAIAEYREIIKIHSRNSNPSYYAFSHFWLARALDKRGNRDEARKEYLIAYEIASQDKKHNKKIRAIAEQSKHFVSQ